MLNQVILIGRLTHDPELRYTAGSGIPLATFDLAVNRISSNQQGERETDFIRIVTWRKQAENCANYLKKGSLAAVSGRLQIRSYEDNEGIKKKIAEVVAFNVQFLERPRDSEETKPGEDTMPGVEDSEISGEDVPF